MTESLKDRLFEYAIGCACDVSHGEGHIKRVVKNSETLLKHYPQADADALIAAAILHDCAQKEQNEDKSVHHAVFGAEKARLFMLKEGFDESFAGKVAGIISAHSSKDQADAQGLEAKLLFDADKLDMTGAVGVSRALMYALDNGLELYSARGESLYSVIDADIAFAESGFFTKEAKEMAKDRLALSKSFLNSLKREAK